MVFLRLRFQYRVVFSRRKGAIKTLKPSFFVSGVVGTFVGFPKHKQVIDGYARCLLCRVDISIAGRGVHNHWDHWKGREHTRLEQKYRIIPNKPLLGMSCRSVSMAEDKRIRAERMSEPPVFPKSSLNLSIDEMTAIGLAEEAAVAKPQLTESIGASLWLCCFINCFTKVSRFDDVMSFMESWSDSMRGEMSFVSRALSFPKCQVVNYFVLTHRISCVN